jgi:hypothetical protein
MRRRVPRSLTTARVVEPLLNSVDSIYKGYHKALIWREHGSGISLSDYRTIFGHITRPIELRRRTDIQAIMGAA